MAISFVAAGATVVGPTVTVTQPAGIRQGDLLLLISSGGSKPTTPAGWTELTTNYFISPAAPWMTVYWKFAAASEASVSLSTNDSAARSGIIAYREAYAFEAIPSFAYGAGGTANLIPIAATSNYRYNTILTIYSTNNSGFATTFTANASTISRVNAASTTTSYGLLVVDEFQNTSGNSTPRAATQSRSQPWGAVSIGVAWPQKYWVGGSGNWDGTAGTKWANTSGSAGGAPVPNTLDEVIFDANSAAPFNSTVTITSPTSIGSLNCLGFTGTLTGSSPLTVSNDSILLSSSMEYGYNGVITIAGNQATLFNANTKNINSNIIITKAATGGVVLLDNVNSSISTSNTIILNSGTLNLNNFVLSTGSFLSSNTTTRGISFGTGTSGAIVLRSGGNTWNTSVTTGLTVSGTSNVTVASFYSAATVTTGALTAAQALNFNYNIGVYTLNDANAVYNSLNFTGFTGTVPNQTRTIFGNFTANTGPTYSAGALVTTFANTTGIQFINANNTINYPIIFGVSAGGTYQLNTNVTFATTNTTTLTAGTLNLNNFILNTGSFASSGALVRAINFGTSNTGAIVLTSSGTPWNTGTVTSLTVSGNSNVTVANASANPITVTTGALTAAQALNFNYNTGTYILTDASAVYNSLNFTGFTGTVTNQTRTIFGNFTANTGPTYRGGTLITTFANTTGTQLINVNDAINYPVTFGVTAGGTYALQNNLRLSSSNSTTFTAGTINLNNFSITTGSFLSTGTLVRAINFGATGNITTTGAGTAWSFNGTGFTTPTGSNTVNITNNTSTATTITNTSLLNFNINAGTYVLTETALNQYNNLNLTGFSGTFGYCVRSVFGNFIASPTATYTPGGTSAQNRLTMGRGPLTVTITSNGVTLPFTVQYGDNSQNGTLSFLDTFRANSFIIDSGTINVNNQSVTSNSLTIGTNTTASKNVNNGIFNVNGPVSFNGGTFRLTSANLVATGAATLASNIDIILNNNTLSLGSLNFSGSLSRSINFGTGQIILTGNNTTIWDFTTATGYTQSGTFRVIANTSGTGTRTVLFGSPATRFDVLSSSTAAAGAFTIASGIDIVQLDGNINNLNLTGYTGSFSQGTLNIFNSATLSSGMTTTGTGTTNFVATSSGQTITTAGKSLVNVNFNGAGGGWTLQDNFAASSNFTVTTGTLSANNQNVSALLYTLTGGTIDMGSGTWTVTGAGTSWNRSATTVLARTSTIALSNTSATALTFAGGSATYFNLSLTGVTGTGALTITGANRFNTLSSLRTGNYTITLPAGQTTIANAWLISGSSATTNFVTLNSSAVGTRATLSIASGTIDPIYARIQDSAATGGATFNATLASNLGNNTGWNFGANPGRYWVGGTGTWNTSSTTNWAATSGGSGGMFVPTAFDNAFFDSNSGSGTVTLTGAILAGSINAIGSSFTFGGTGTPTISGNLTLSNTTVWNATGAITFNANTTVNTNGVVVNSANIILSTANTLTLSGNLTLGASNNFTHSNGTVNLNNSILTANSFNTSTANTRRIEFGTGSINLVGNGNTIWNGAVATGFSTTGSSNVKFTYAGAVGTRTIVHGSTGGSITTANLNFGIVSGSDTVAITTGSQMNDLDFTGFTGTFAPAAAYTLYGNLIASSAMTWTTGTGTITFASTSSGRTINTAGKSLFAVTFTGIGGEWSLQNAMTATSAMTLTSGRLILNGFDASCLTFSSDTSNTRGVTFGSNNINITFVGTTGTTTVINMATMTGFSYTGTGGFRLTGASPAAVVRQTNLSGTAGGSAANAPNLWVSAGSDIISIPTSAWIGNLDFTGYTGTWSLPTGTTNIAGSFTVASGMTITPLTNSITFASTSTGRTINTAGKSLYAVTFNGVGGEWSLQNAMTATNAMTLTSGRLILNGFDATCLTFSGTGTTTRDITFGANNINITSTATGTVLDITNATGFTPSGTGAFRLSGAAASGITRTSVVGTTGGAVATAPNVFVSAGAAGSIFALTTSSWVQDLNFTGFSGTFAPAALTRITGNLIASAAMTWTTGTGNITFAATSTGDIITTAGKTLNNITFDGVGGGWTLQDTMTANNIVFNKGTVNRNNQNITANTILVSGGTT
jgi:hypothetical protein